MRNVFARLVHETENLFTEIAQRKGSCAKLILLLTCKEACSGWCFGFDLINIVLWPCSVRSTCFFTRNLGVFWFLNVRSFYNGQRIVM
jgi:hypothetical protein